MMEESIVNLETNSEAIGHLINQLLEGSVGKAANDRPRNALRRDGSSQRRRLPIALADGYFRIDEHETADLLDFAHRLAVAVKFADNESESQKDWQVFFAQDPSMVLVATIKYPLMVWQATIEQEISRLGMIVATLRNVPDSPTPTAATTVALAIQSLIGECIRGKPDIPSPAMSIVGWHARLANEPIFRRDFENTLQGLVRRQVQDLIHLHFELSKAAEYTPWFSFDGEIYRLPLDPWGWEAMRTVAPYLQGSPLGEPVFYKGVHLADKLNSVLATLSRIVHALSQACSGLQTMARAQFELSLKSHATHRPHMGLFLAFLQIYHHAQDRLNEIGPAHLDFYYQEVLRFAPELAHPDRVHLIASLSGSTSKIAMPAQTKFVAPDKRVYATTEEWSLNRATIGRLCAVLRSDGLHTLTQGETSGILPEWPAHPGLQQMAPATVGWAFASPVLSMEAGRRRIKVGIVLGRGNHRLSKEAIGQITALFQACTSLEARITTKHGWEEIPQEAPPQLIGTDQDPTVGGWMPATFSDADVLVFSLKAEVESPAIIGYDSALHGPGWDTNDPILQFRLEVGTSAHELYGTLATTNVLAWNISVGVVNAKPRMENDEGILDGSKPFAPFGQQPTLRSRWAIDIDEALSKNPLQLAVKWFWEQFTGAQISTYFQAYSDYMLETGEWDEAISGSDFVAKVEVFQRTKLLKDYGILPLYEEDRRRRRLRFARTKDGEYAPLPPSDAVEHWKKPVAETIRHGHYLQLSFFSTALAPQAIAKGRHRTSIAFGHQHYPLVLSHNTQKLQRQQILALRNPTGEAGAMQVSTPNPPLKPTIVQARVWYLATDGWMRNPDEIASGTGEFFHLGPFGQVKVDSHEGSLPLAPFFEAGVQWYIGLQNFNPPSQLSLLLQLRAGSGDPELQLPVATWRYLSGAQWRSFLPSEMPSDETRGLQQSGLVRLDIPKEANLPQTALPSGFTWIQLQVNGSGAALDQVLGIHAQGFVATLQQEGSQGMETVKMLTPGSLTKPTSYVQGLKVVAQPYASFGGTQAATIPQFRAAVSERLRHKNRMVSILDYEQLVLERFPDVYKVRCINHAAPMGTEVQGKPLAFDNELMPGHLIVVCIPRTPALEAINPLQPRFGRDVLSAIQDYLQAAVPPFVTVHVTNPHYQSLMLHGQVAFKPNVDAGLATIRLNAAIARYLCPWAFEASEEIHFGGQVHRSQLLKLIEQQPEVDVVAQFHITLDGEQTAEADWIKPSASRAVLVAAQTHELEPTAIEKLVYDGSAVYGGINFWRIKEDFIVTGN